MSEKISNHYCPVQYSYTYQQDGFPTLRLFWKKTEPTSKNEEKRFGYQTLNTFENGNTFS